MKMSWISFMRARVFLDVHGLWESEWLHEMFECREKWAIAYGRHISSEFRVWESNFFRVWKVYWFFWSMQGMFAHQGSLVFSSKCMKHASIWLWINAPGHCLSTNLASTEYTVSFDSSTDRDSCSRHALKVLGYQNIKILPSRRIHLEEVD